MRVRLWVSVVVVLLVLVAIASGQKTTGMITGVVTDGSGAAVVEESVTITSTQTGATRTSNTNSEGSFSFPELNPGVYNISVTKQGFKKVQEKNVELHVSDITNGPIKLPLGTVAETVVVEATAVQVESQTGTVCTVGNGEE